MVIVYYFWGQSQAYVAKVLDAYSDIDQSKLKSLHGWVPLPVIMILLWSYRTHSKFFFKISPLVLIRTVSIKL